MITVRQRQAKLSLDAAEYAGILELLHVTALLSRRVLQSLFPGEIVDVSDCNYPRAQGCVRGGLESGQEGG